MKIRVFLMLAFVVCINAVTAAELKPFTTDGCSVFPNGNFDQSSKWMQCCIRHDFAYWKGGTYAEREAADSELRQCVADLGEDSISELMYLGVRLGGTPISLAWYRWGYGWSELRGYQELTAEDNQQVNERLTSLRNLVDELINQQ